MTKNSFRLTVDMRNAAFQDNPDELITVLEQVIIKIKFGFRDAPLFDSNGNKIGEFTTS